MAANKGTKRSAKVPSRYTNGNVVPAKPARKDVSKWFTVRCLEDHKEYFCTTKELETLDGLEINEDEIELDDTVLWCHKGAAYEARIVDFHDKKPMPGSSVKRRQSKFDEDSSSDEEETHATTPVSKKKVETLKSHSKEVKVSKKGVSSNGDEAEDVQSVDGSSDDDLTNQKQAPKQKVPTTVSSSSTNRKQPPHQKVPTTISNSSLGLKLSSLSSPASSPVKVAKNDDDVKEILTRVTAMERKLDMLISRLTSSPTNLAAPSVNTPLADVKENTVNDESTDTKFVTDKGVNLISIRANQPDNFALALMDALFTDEVMATCCYARTKRSTKTPLPQDKITLGRMYGKEVWKRDYGYSWANDSKKVLPKVYRHSEQESKGGTH